MSTGAQLERNLAEFNPGEFTLGASRAYVAAWWLASHLLFQAWWLPRGFRPRILRSFGAEIGSDVQIREGVYIHLPWRLKVGNNCWIGRQVNIYNHAEVAIEANVCISQHATISSGNHNPRTRGLDFDHRPVTLSHGAWICAAAFVGPGSVLEVNELVMPGTSRQQAENRNPTKTGKAVSLKCSCLESAAKDQESLRQEDV